MNNLVLNRMQQLSNIANMVKGGNPEQLVKQMAKNSNNPMLNNLIKEMDNGNLLSVETFGRNFFKERGIDLDEQMNTLHSIINNFK